MNCLVFQPPSRYSHSLVFHKEWPIAEDLRSQDTPKEAIDVLKAQSSFSKVRLSELTYGPERPKSESFEPLWAKLDSKMLSFEGVMRESVDDWSTEKSRVRYLKVFYYLENDTMQVTEPRTPNSGLYQGTLLRRDRYLHPNGKRYYSWKDLNIGVDVIIFGKHMHLIDCDTWTRQYLTDAGVDVKTAESKPVDPHTEMRLKMLPRRVYRTVRPSTNFYLNEGKVLRFYGIWKDDSTNSLVIRRIVLKFYLSDDSLEVIQIFPPNSGWAPLLPVKAGAMDITYSTGGKGSFNTVIRRQRVLLDRQKDTDKLPCYLQPQDIDDVTWTKAEHLKTGEDIEILGKTFFLSKCDDYTSHYYKEHFGVNLLNMELMEKPKPRPPKIIPPHDIGPYDETLQDCYTPFSQPPKRIHRPIPPKTEEMTNTVLRFAAFMDTPREAEKTRKFVVSFHMEDHTVKISEENVQNSGFGGGPFLARTRLRREKGSKGQVPHCYEVWDFYIGARIQSKGCTFVLNDADESVFKFMESHPEIYTDISVVEQKKLFNTLKGKTELTSTQRLELREDLRNSVLLKCGSPIFPAPSLGSGMSPRDIVEEKLYSANLPIPKGLLKKLVDAFTFKGKTNVDEVQTFLLVALGHKKDHLV